MRIMAVSHPCVTDVNQQFYAELEDLGHDVHLVVPAKFRTDHGTIPNVKRWEKYRGGITQLSVGMPSSIPLHFYTKSLRRIIRHYQPEVLYVEEEPYSASAFQSFLASGRLPLIRIVYSAQNIVKRYPIPFRNMENYVFKRADVAAVVSDAVGNTLRQKGYEKEVLRLPLGVDLGQFSPSIQGRQLVRERLGLENAFTLGYIGRFVEEKGVRTLVRLLPLLRECGAKLVMVGNGQLRDELMNTRRDFPDVLFIIESVPHNDIQNWFNALDCLVLPSLTRANWKEQFGRVIIEAMACGVPVVGSDSGEIPRLIRETGGGWCFPEDDHQGLFEVIREIMNNSERGIAVGSSGLEYVRDHYSKKAMAKTFDRCLNELMKRRLGSNARALKLENGNEQGIV